MPAPFDVLISPTKTLGRELRRAKASTAAVNFALSILAIMLMTLPASFAKIPGPLSLALIALIYVATFGLSFISLIHVIAVAFGGRERVLKLAYAISIAALPLSFFFAIFSVLGLPFLSAILIFYGAYVVVIAVEKCYNFGALKSLGTVILASIASIVVTFAITNALLAPLLIDVYEWISRVVLAEQSPEIRYLITRDELQIEIINAKNESARVSIIGQKISLNASLAPGEIKRFYFGIRCERVFEDTIKVQTEQQEITVPLIARCP